MRIGVIFFGLPRCSHITLPSIKKYVLDQLIGHEVFIESCLSYQLQVANPRSGESSDLRDDNYHFFKQHPCTLLTPDEMLDQKLKARLLEFGDSWDDEGKSLNNLLLQLFTLQNAYLKCKEHACDFYIFVRPDLLIQTSIPIKTFISRFHKKNVAMIPSWQWWGGGVNDRFAVTTYLSADAFAMRYSNILAYCEKTQVAVHSENFVLNEYLKANVKIKTCASKMSRVRVNGQIRDEDFSIESLGVNKKIFYALRNQVSLAHFVTDGVRVINLFYHRGVNKAFKNIKRIFLGE